jgi:hypothetical protein
LLFKIERILPASDNDQMREVVYPLSEKAYYSLSDGHLWFSIFSGPPLTKFTRVQRCICCFVLLFTVMLLNILYYEQEQKAKVETRAGGLSLGPFYFTPEQVCYFVFYIFYFLVVLLGWNWIYC